MQINESFFDDSGFKQSDIGEFIKACQEDRLIEGTRLYKTAKGTYNEQIARTLTEWLKNAIVGDPDSGNVNHTFSQEDFLNALMMVETPKALKLLGRTLGVGTRGIAFRLSGGLVFKKLFTLFKNTNNASFYEYALKKQTSRILTGGKNR